MKIKYYSLKLSIAIIGVFILQVIVAGFTELFVLDKSAWFQIWRFATAIFLHGGIAHLLFNLLALVLFGSALETFIGSRRFLLVFFVTGICANIISVLFYPSSLGASGAIFGVIGALIFIRPGMVVWAFGMPMPLFVAGILWAAGDLLGAYGFLTGNPIDNVGNIAHLSGMFFGFIFGAVYRRRMARQNRINVSIDEGEVRLWEDKFLRRPYKVL